MSHRGQISDKSQDGQVLAWLQSGKELDPMTALRELGCFRLAARSYCLRREGIPIEERIVREGRKHWAAYRLAIAHG